MQAARTPARTARYAEALRPVNATRYAHRGHRVTSVTSVPPSERTRRHQGGGG